MSARVERASRSPWTFDILRRLLQHGLLRSELGLLLGPELVERLEQHFPWVVVVGRLRCGFCIGSAEVVAHDLGFEVLELRVEVVGRVCG